MPIVIFLILIGAYLGPYAFIVWPKLHFIRLFPLVGVLGIVAVKRPVISKNNLLIIIFFTIYFAYTILLSLTAYSEERINHLINFVCLYFFLCSLIVTIDNFKQDFLKIFIWVQTAFLVTSFLLCLYEVFTLKHLYLSGMYETAPIAGRYHLPTTFFTNSNDFAAIFLFATMFLLTVISGKKPAYAVLYKTILIFACCFVIYSTESRINFLAFGIFLIIYFALWRLKHFVGLCLVGFFIVLAVEPIRDKLNEKLFNSDFSAGSSLQRRYSLYVNALKSIPANYGLGLGLGVTQEYYKELPNKSELYGDTDPHNYLLEMLLNSGLYILIVYLILFFYLLYSVVKKNVGRLQITQLLLYHFILLSSSFSIFLWPHYLYFLVYVNFIINIVHKETYSFPAEV